ncbi:hypothetical protein Tco_1292296 [Tanacetum coccineum]
MARDHQLKSKTSMGIQREEEAAKCLMCLDDPVTPPAIESGAQVEESAYTISGEKRGQGTHDKRLQVEEYITVQVLIIVKLCGR